MNTSHIENFLREYDLSKIQEITDIYGFTQYKIGLESDINEYITRLGYLDGKDTNFSKAVLQSNENIFRSDDISEIELLRDIITLKNTLYRKIFAQVVSQKKILFLTTQEQIGLVQICESGILELFDTLYRNWRRALPQEKNSNLRQGRNNLVYGGIKNDAFVSYAGFVSPEQIQDVLEKLDENNHIHTNLIAMLRAMQAKNYEYSSWVQIEERTEVPLWKDSGNVALCMPMESYIMSEILVEPEVSFFFKKQFTQANQRNAGLSKKYFDEDFGMGEVHYFICIDILFAGMASFVRHAGRNFPNDIQLAKKAGKLIYFMPHAFDRIYENGVPLVQKLFENIANLEKQAIYEEFEQHVENHEFGHNLFYRNDSDLEESKPSLFHCLALLEQSTGVPFSQKKLEACINFFLLDFMRDIERGYHNYKNNPIYKYVLYSRCVLKELLQTGIISWTSQNTMKIQYDMQKFIYFLENMYLVLQEIQKIYAHPQKDGERELIEKIESGTQKDFEKIAHILGLTE